jgi:HEAT repeat protein
MCPKQQELVYQGRSIDYWFAQLPITWVGPKGMLLTGGSIIAFGQQYGNQQDASLPFAAFDSFGNDAIPYLMSKLTSRDSTLELTARNAALKAKLRSFPTRMARIESFQAVTGLIYLKELPTDIIKTLTDLSKDTNSEVADAAGYVLSKINLHQAGTPDADQTNSKTANIRIQVDAAARRD